MQMPSDLIRSHLYSKGIPTNDYIVVESFSHDYFLRSIKNAIANELEYSQPYSYLSVVTNGVTSTLEDVGEDALEPTSTVAALIAAFCAALASCDGTAA